MESNKIIQEFASKPRSLDELSPVTMMLLAAIAESLELEFLDIILAIYTKKHADVPLVAAAGIFITIHSTTAIKDNKKKYDHALQVVEYITIDTASLFIMGYADPNISVDLMSERFYGREINSPDDLLDVLSLIVNTKQSESIN